MSSRLAISAFSRSVSPSIASSASRRSTAVGARRLVEQVRHRRLDRGERAPEIVRDGGEQRPAHALGLPVDLGLRRGAQEPVALEDQRELIAERAEDAALGGRERRPVALAAPRGRASVRRPTAGAVRAAARASGGPTSPSPIPAAPPTVTCWTRPRTSSVCSTNSAAASKPNAFFTVRSATSIVSSPGTRVVELTAELLDRAELGLASFGGPRALGRARQQHRDDHRERRGTRTAPPRTRAGRSSTCRTAAGRRS